MGLALCWLCYGEVLDRDTMRGDVVDLARSGHINQIVGLNLNLVARRQEGVEAHNEVWMAFEELGDSADHTWCINADNTRTINLWYLICNVPRINPRVQKRIIMTMLANANICNNFI